MRTAKLNKKMHLKCCQKNRRNRSHIVSRMNIVVFSVQFFLLRDHYCLVMIQRCQSTLKLEIFVLHLPKKTHGS